VTDIDLPAFKERTAMILTSPLLIAAVAAPQAQPDPTIASAKTQLLAVKGYVTKAVDQVPDDMYAFKPTADVRSLGQLFGHIADANVMMCSAATGKKPDMTGIEKSKTTKADLKAALEASFAFCEAAFDGLTAASGAEPVKFFLPGTSTRLSVLAFNTAHDFEHYGNIVTYMRRKGLVPPSSAPR
jgi:uncharacterized damage-inducible protein DinB